MTKYVVYDDRRGKMVRRGVTQAWIDTVKDIPANKGRFRIIGECSPDIDKFLKSKEGRHAKMFEIEEMLHGPAPIMEQEGPILEITPDTVKKMTTKEVEEALDHLGLELPEGKMTLAKKRNFLISEIR